MTTITHHRCMSGPGTIKCIHNFEHEVRAVAARRRNDAKDLTRTAPPSPLPARFWRAA